MKNLPVALIASTIVIVLVSVALLIVSSGEDPLAKNPTNDNSGSAQTITQAQPRQIPEGVSAEDIIVPGYIEYNANTVSQTSGSKIIFFHASWCPTCTALDKNIKAGSVPEDLTIFKANYDTETELRKKYGVTIQHTLVQIDDQGNELNQWLGSLTIEQLVRELI